MPPELPSMTYLIARSSLGTPKATRARARVSLERAQELLARSEQTDRSNGPEKVGEQSGHQDYTSGVDAVPPRRDDAARHQAPVAPRGRPGGTMRKSYPATKAGLRRLGHDMQAEIEKNLRPVNVPVRYRYETIAGGVTAGPWPNSGTIVNNHHHGDVVTVDGDNNLIAVGNNGPVEQRTDQTANQWRLDLLAALGNVQNRLDELDLDEEDRDTIEDAATSAAAIAAEHGDDGDDDVDDTALRRRARKVLNTLEKVGVAASGGTLAHELAGPLQQLLS